MFNIDNEAVENSRSIYHVKQTKIFKQLKKIKKLNYFRTNLELLPYKKLPFKVTKKKHKQITLYKISKI